MAQSSPAHLSPQLCEMICTSLKWGSKYSPPRAVRIISTWLDWILFDLDADSTQFLHWVMCDLHTESLSYKLDPTLAHAIWQCEFILQETVQETSSFCGIIPSTGYEPSILNSKQSDPAKGLPSLDLLRLAVSQANCHLRASAHILVSRLKGPVLDQGRVIVNRHCDILSTAIAEGNDWEPQCHHPRMNQHGDGLQLPLHIDAIQDDKMGTRPTSRSTTCRDKPYMDLLLGKTSKLPSNANELTGALTCSSGDNTASRERATLHHCGPGPPEAIPGPNGIYQRAAPGLKAGWITRMDNALDKTQRDLILNHQDSGATNNESKLTMIQLEYHGQVPEPDEPSSPCDAVEHNSILEFMQTGRKVSYCQMGQIVDHPDIQIVLYVTQGTVMLGHQGSRFVDNGLLSDQATTVELKAAVMFTEIEHTANTVSIAAAEEDKHVLWNSTPELKLDELPGVFVSASLRRDPFIIWQSILAKAEGHRHSSIPDALRDHTSTLGFTSSGKDKRSHDLRQRMDPVTQFKHKLVAQYCYVDSSCLLSQIAYESSQEYKITEPMNEAQANLYLQDALQGPDWSIDRNMRDKPSLEAAVQCHRRSSPCCMRTYACGPIIIACRSVTYPREGPFPTQQGVTAKAEAEERHHSTTQEAPWESRPNFQMTSQDHLHPDSDDLRSLQRCKDVLGTSNQRARAEPPYGVKDLVRTDAARGVIFIYKGVNCTLEVQDEGCQDTPIGPSSSYDAVRCGSILKFTCSCHPVMVLSLAETRKNEVSSRNHYPQIERGNIELQLPPQIERSHGAAQTPLQANLFQGSRLQMPDHTSAQDTTVQGCSDDCKIEPKRKIGLRSGLEPNAQNSVTTVSRTGTPASRLGQGVRVTAKEMTFMGKDKHTPWSCYRQIEWSYGPVPLPLRVNMLQIPDCSGTWDTWNEFPHSMQKQELPVTPELPAKMKQSSFECLGIHDIFIFIIMSPQLSVPDPVQIKRIPDPHSSAGLNELVNCDNPRGSTAEPIKILRTHRTGANSVNESNWNGLTCPRLHLGSPLECKLHTRANWGTTDEEVQTRGAARKHCTHFGIKEGLPKFKPMEYELELPELSTHFCKTAKELDHGPESRKHSMGPSVMIDPASSGGDDTVIRNRAPEPQLSNLTSLSETLKLGLTGRSPRPELSFVTMSTATIGRIKYLGQNHSPDSSLITNKRVAIEFDLMMIKPEFARTSYPEDNGVDVEPPHPREGPSGNGWPGLVMIGTDEHAPKLQPNELFETRLATARDDIVQPLSQADLLLWSMFYISIQMGAQPEWNRSSLVAIVRISVLMESSKARSPALGLGQGCHPKRDPPAILSFTQVKTDKRHWGIIQDSLQEPLSDYETIQPDHLPPVKAKPLEVHSKESGCPIVMANSPSIIPLGGNGTHSPSWTPRWSRNASTYVDYSENVTHPGLLPRGTGTPSFEDSLLPASNPAGSSILSPRPKAEHCLLPQIAPLSPPRPSEPKPDILYSYEGCVVTSSRPRMGSRPYSCIPKLELNELPDSFASVEFRSDRSNPASEGAMGPMSGLTAKYHLNSAMIRNPNYCRDGPYYITQMDLSEFEVTFRNAPQQTEYGDVAQPPLSPNSSMESQLTVIGSLTATNELVHLKSIYYSTSPTIEATLAPRKRQVIWEFDIGRRSLYPGKDDLESRITGRNPVMAQGTKIDQKGTPDLIQEFRDDRATENEWEFATIQLESTIRNSEAMPARNAEASAFELGHAPMLEYTVERDTTVIQARALNKDTNWEEHKLKVLMWSDSSMRMDRFSYEHLDTKLDEPRPCRLPAPQACPNLAWKPRKPVLGPVEGS
ncbi:hypothetical protein BS47DRAFT_1365801 [Hydnum rufescens UP504]|uniref:Uncharacterized protein n=1 Tax=Hydnum rufescens UP504 TaxID=1448309 RepID=A0A9P6AN61_9AGAM|nr:hypothetical protein BS47DRAFT_1365801 [Hydnum rufescens UP504]